MKPDCNLSLNEMTIYLDVLDSLMKYRVSCDVNGHLIIAIIVTVADDGLSRSRIS